MVARSCRCCFSSNQLVARANFDWCWDQDGLKLATIWQCLGYFCLPKQIDASLGLSGWGQMTKPGVESHQGYYRRGKIIDLHARLSVYRKADEPQEELCLTALQPVLDCARTLCGCRSPAVNSPSIRYIWCIRGHGTFFLLWSNGRLKNSPWNAKQEDRAQW